MNVASRRCICSIVPPHILLKLISSDDKEVREAALNTLLATSRLRGERSLRATLGLATASPANGRRTVFDCQNSRFLAAAALVRSEDGGPVTDAAANRVFDGFGVTRDFFSQVFDRDSIDGAGMRLNGYVHFGLKYNNAFWDGEQMVFGDGDALRFADFTLSLDVIGHELAHGVTEKTAGLLYRNQSGALNESISDVFGSLVKQWLNQESAQQADWLIGAEIFTPSVGADALRSLKAPGTAYDNPFFGKDPQPDHMSKFVHLPDTEEGDFGGVHINSGIPNKAFYLTAISIGGNAWDAPGHIWYESLQASTPTTDFQEFADTTYLKAGQLYGTGSEEQQAVQGAWKDVGLRISGVSPVTSRVRPSVAHASHNNNDEGLVAVKRKVEALAVQVKALSKQVAQLVE